jgi:uncharacterized membrane protein YhiD involved in acid resistance
MSLKNMKKEIVLDENGNECEVYIMYCRKSTEAQKKASKKYNESHKEYYAKLKRDKYKNDSIYRELHKEKVKHAYHQKKMYDIQAEFKRLCNINI